MLLYSSQISHFDCLNSTASISRLIISTRACVLLPLSFLIIGLGAYRCWRPRSFPKTSHSDVFTYHWIFMEVFLVSGTIFAYYGDTAGLHLMTAGGILSITVSYSGQNTFHLLTCMERYLAVVHPVTYRGLNNSRGNKIRNVCIFLAWLMSLTWMGIQSGSYPNFPTVSLLCAISVSLVVVSFCSVSVLLILNRTVAGVGKRHKGQANHTKDRAFFTISAIMGALWFWFAGFLIFLVVDAAQLVNMEVLCLVKGLFPAFNLPSSLVLPLLYLHRVQRPSCCYK